MMKSLLVMSRPPLWPCEVSCSSSCNAPWLTSMQNLHAYVSYPTCITISPLPIFFPSPPFLSLHHIPFMHTVFSLIYATSYHQSHAYTILSSMPHLSNPTPSSFIFHSSPLPPAYMDLYARRHSRFTTSSHHHTYSLFHLSHHMPTESISLLTNTFHHLLFKISTHSFLSLHHVFFKPIVFHSLNPFPSPLHGHTNLSTHPSYPHTCMVPICTHFSYQSSFSFSKSTYLSPHH